ncbi:SGNH/GDSL hydrolase family protein [Stenotrophomonas sp. ATs4]|uniref:SGNH/GDSL hydrolase family protein n=1 Tax=Stenotrophomonas sp. ATs4 TaxID=3402766 RepID=UPI003F71B6FD
MSDSQAGRFRTPISAALLRGWIELEETPSGILPHRLPQWARTQCEDKQLAMVEQQPSGVRLCFSTEATTIELEALPTKRLYVGMPPRPDGIYDLLLDGAIVAQGSIAEGNLLRVDLAKWAADAKLSGEMEPGSPGRLQFAGLPGGEKAIEIWLPHDEITELVALRTNAPVRPAPPSGHRLWLHHGSSISQGSNSAHPSGIWPAVAASRGRVDLMNLGLGGNALLDPFLARIIRDQSADLISLKLGINIVNMDLMRLRAFGTAVHGFLDTIRDGHPTTPLLIVSPIFCPIHEQTPGPGAPDFSDGQLKFRATGDERDVAKGALTLTVIRDSLCAIVAQRRERDPNIHYLDGRHLYGEQDHELQPLPDRLHPDSATHRLIGERFAATIFGGDCPFG